MKKNNTTEQILEKIYNYSLEEIMGERFGRYSKYIIQDRAIPDVRDGLKPVQRRILYAMYIGHNTYDKPYRKSAKTVGDVIGSFHPHGDTSIYDAMVRLSQDWKIKNPMIDMHGNNGSIDGDSPAAYRYTEARLSKISLELLRDIKKDTVDMDDNFDVTSKEPKVLPSRFPNVLVNGSMGIAVGMATNIPPHNLGEVIDGCVAYIDNPEIDTLGLMQYVKGPDFPTGGIILGNSGIKKAYDTGRGSITIRSKATIEEHGNHNNIVITEVPYGVNTLELKNKVGELVRDKIIDGISDYHTDLKDGVKITITLKKDANPQVVLNNLYKHTNFQISYGINFLVIDDGTPRTLPLKDIIAKYIDHQRIVIIRRTKFDLDKAEARVHILEGYKIALDHLDDVIKIIRESETDVIAKEELIKRFGFSDIQVDAILELKLRRLTGLERDKIEQELAETLKLIEELKAILASREKIDNIIKTEMLEIKDKYADERRTSIDMTAIDYIEDESLIPVENIMISLTEKGYIKRLAVNTYRTQNRGGVGIKGMTTNEEDNVNKLITSSTHDDILFFSNYGKVYRVRGYEIPLGSRQSKGLPIINLIPIEKEEKVTSIISIDPKEVNDEKNLVFVTKHGLVKRTNIKEFESIRNNGKIAITLKEDDELINVNLTDGTNEIIIAANNGRMVRFNEKEVRLMGRTASGVKGIELDNSYVIGAEVANSSKLILVITEKGYGKKTETDEYRLTHRGGKGVKALNITDKNGLIVAFKSVVGDEDIIITTNSGIVIRLDVNKISTLKRNTQGVRLISLKDNQIVTNVTVTEKEESEEEIIEE